MNIGTNRRGRTDAGGDLAQLTKLKQSWYLGLLTNAFAVLFILLALNYASINIVLPLSTLTLAINSVCVPLFNGTERKLQKLYAWSSVKGSCVCLTGAYLMLSSVQKYNTAFSAEHLQALSRQNAFIALQLLCVCWIFFLFHRVKTQPMRHHGRRANLLMFFSTAAGWAGAQQYLCLKCLVELRKVGCMTTGPCNHLSLAIILFFSFILFGIQLFFVNLGLKTFDEDTVRFIGVYQACFLISGCISGGIYFQEFKYFQETDWILFSGGLILMLWGISIITIFGGLKHDQRFSEHDTRESGPHYFLNSWLCGACHIRADLDSLPKVPEYSDDLAMAAEFDHVWGRHILW